MVALALAALALAGSAAALDNGLARTPPMGWNSWNFFNCNINEEIIRGVADAIVNTGLASAGYKYIVIDDCWSLKKRDPVTKRIVADPERFPSGMKGLSDYIHSKGLLFGMYSDAGTKTCAGYPGSLNNEQIDADTFASWGIDFLKYDNCNNLLLPAEPRYTRMRDALNSTGRPILYSICNWGQAKPWNWGPKVGNMWRTTLDISPDFDGKSSSAMKILDQQVAIVDASAPGGFNDPDMLEVGNPGMTPGEQRAHFFAWVAIKAPLILGNDVRNMNDATFKLLSNPELIAVNQDSLGQSARLVRRSRSATGNLDTWVGLLADGSYVAVLINRGVTAEKFELPKSLFEITAASMSMNVRDLFARSNLGVYSDTIEVVVEPHDARILKVNAFSGIAVQN